MSFGVRLVHSWRGGPEPSEKRKNPRVAHKETTFVVYTTKSRFFFECVMSRMNECVMSHMNECVMSRMNECVMSHMNECVMSHMNESCNT